MRIYKKYCGKKNTKTETEKNPREKEKR